MSETRYFCLRGFMKSGTNWLGALLSSHEEISVTGEFHWEELAGPLNRLMQQDLYEAEGLKQKTRVEFQEFVKRCLVNAAEPGASLIGDRTPHTLAPVILPDSPHVSIVRDGRDVLVSRAFHLYNNANVHQMFHRVPEMKKDHQRFVENPWYFKENPGQLLRHEALVRESVCWWRKHLESDRNTVSKHPYLSVRSVRYEDLHQDTAKVRAELFEFLGVDPGKATEIEGMLKPGFREERPNDFFRKGSVGDWENYFTDQTRRWFKQYAGEELVRQGYEASNNW